MKLKRKTTELRSIKSDSFVLSRYWFLGVFGFGAGGALFGLAVSLAACCLALGFAFPPLPLPLAFAFAAAEAAFLGCKTSGSSPGNLAGFWESRFP